MGPLAARRQIGEGGQARGAKPPGLDPQDILDEWTSAGWLCPLLFLAREEDLTQVSGGVSVWTNLGTDTGNDAVQAIAGNRPTWDATGLNGKPTIDFDGTDNVTTATYNASAYTAAVIIMVFQDQKATLESVATFGPTNVGGNGSFGSMNNYYFSTTAGSIGALAGFADRFASVTSYPMDDPAVVSLTYDTAETGTARIGARHAGVAVSGSRSVTTGGALGTHVFQIGSGLSTTIGQISAAMMAVGTTAIPTATVANVEALLAAEWGL